MAVDTSQQLPEAIDSASPSTLRSVLRALCADVETRDRVEELISKLQKYAQPSGSTPSNKRKRDAKIEICVQCDQPFEEGDTSKTCRYHSEALEVDYDADAWADHDEDCHGPHDQPWLRREFPEGFYFPCCNRRGDAEGCALGQHRAVDGKRVKCVIDVHHTRSEEDDEDEDSNSYSEC